MAFIGEEAGLVGSKYFVNNPLVPLNSIDFVLNLDLSGTGSEGIYVVNATLYPEVFDQLVAFAAMEIMLQRLKNVGLQQIQTIIILPKMAFRHFLFIPWAV